MTMTLGDRIRLARRAKGWYQHQLAKAVGVEPPTISRWENDIIAPDPQNLKALADALGKSAEWFEPDTLGIEDRLRALEDLNAKLKPAPLKEYSALSPIPPELFAKYNTDLAHQLLTNYFLTRQDQYIEHLGTEIIEHVEAISRLLGLKRSPSPTSGG